MISPSLICLSSRDPLLTAFELYGELKRLEKMETEFRAEYHVIKNSIILLQRSNGKISFCKCFKYVFDY